MSDNLEKPVLQVGDMVYCLSDVIKHLKITGKWEGILTRLAEEAVIRLEAEKSKVHIEDNELQQEFNILRKNIGLLSKEQTVKWLESNGIDIINIQKEAEIILMKQKLYNMYAKEDDINKYFQENKPSFDAISVSELIVKEEGIAYELLAQLQEEEIDFHSAAIQYSVDINTKSKGGYLGWIRRGMFNSEIESRLFGGSPGEIAGPFITKTGYHLYNIHEIKPATLDNSTKKEISDIFYNENIKELLKKQEIRIY